MNRLRYREIAPPADLADVVECFWTSSGEGLDGDSQNHRVFPDGCVDILFFAESRSGGGFVGGDSLALVGTMTKFKDFFLPANPFFFAVRFKPAGVSGFLPFPTSEVTDLTVPMSDVWGAEAEGLLEKMACASSPGGCLRALAKGLREKLRLGTKQGAPTAQDAVKCIVGANRQVSLEKLAPSLAASSRHLRRLVREHAGIGPKQLCRVMRFQRLLRSLSNLAKPDWAGLALECGYYDQAHMINEFRDLGGLTPRQFHMARTASREAEFGAARAPGTPEFF